MARPRPTPVFHFTHLEHLATLVEHGLQSDTRVQGTTLLAHEAGDRGIKAHRRARRVSDGPGGFVSDYVPFYFAPRSPMMYAIHRGRVPEFTSTIYDLAYVITSLETLQAAGYSVVLTDRNAAKAVAEFSADPHRWDDLVDWPLMKAHMWNNTVDDPERQERRMAECLVPESLPWDLIEHIVVADQTRQQWTEGLLTALGDHTPVHVRRNWYF